MRLNITPIFCRCGPLIFSLAALFFGGCTANHYKKSADKEVYKIIQQKQQQALGETNAFRVETRYSERKPADIKPGEIIEDRSREARQILTLPDALKIAVENNRNFQLRKETLYLTALSLTRERFAYVPQFFGGSTVSAQRESDGDVSAQAANRLGFDTLFKTGGRLSLDLANDLLRFYTGGPRKSAVTTIGLTLSQPLLRGAGAEIAYENLTQAERNVIYEIRGFSYFQDTFAFDIVSTYLRLVQQQDTVRNQYTNYLNRVALSQRAVALSFDRLAKVQADQASQEELVARNSYILAVDRYRNSLDSFKLTLGVPVGYEFQLDENALKEMETLGLLSLPLGESDAYHLALDKRPDLLNEIDAFEDSKRRIKVAANRLKPDLNLFANASLESERPTDYANFNLDEYRVGGGVELDLPFNRLNERNNYRAAFISFERQLRTLALFLDDLKNDIRADLRTVEQSRQSYEIQNSAKALADRRLESSELNLQAGRVQVRDVVDAQTAWVQAYNAATAALVDYHLARLRTLLDMGVLNTAREKFWLLAGDLPGATQTAPVQTLPQTLIDPDKLFYNANPSTN